MYLCSEDNDSHRPSTSTATSAFIKRISTMALEIEVEQQIRMN
jgi:hypothetical protein